MTAIQDAVAKLLALGETDAAIALLSQTSQGGSTFGVQSGVQLSPQMSPQLQVASGPQMPVAQAGPSMPKAAGSKFSFDFNQAIDQNEGRLGRSILLEAGVGSVHTSSDINRLNFSDPDSPTYTDGGLWIPKDPNCIRLTSVDFTLAEYNVTPGDPSKGKRSGVQLSLRFSILPGHDSAFHPGEKDSYPTVWLYSDQSGIVFPNHTAKAQPLNFVCTAKNVGGTLDGGKARAAQLITFLQSKGWKVPSILADAEGAPRGRRMYTSLNLEGMPSGLVAPGQTINTQGRSNPTNGLVLSSVAVGENRFQPEGADYWLGAGMPPIAYLDRMELRQQLLNGEATVPSNNGKPAIEGVGVGMLGRQNADYGASLAFGIWLGRNENDQPQLNTSVGSFYSMQTSDFSWSAYN